MSDQDDSESSAIGTRRAFLVATAAGVVGGTGLSEEAEARVHRQSKPEVSQEAVVRQSSGHGAFLNDDDYATVAAIAERLMPASGTRPGAKEANVVNYIDAALSGAYVDQQYFYRQGLAALDAYCVASHKDSFVYLKPAVQDDIIAAMEEGKAVGFTWPSARNFFETLRTHTIEGMFCDPIYGGNKDFAGWRAVGFPGAQLTYSPEDMASPKAFTRVPTVGLQHSVRKTGRKI